MSEMIWLRYRYHDIEKDKHYAVSLQVQGLEVVMEQDEFDIEYPATIEKQSEDIQRLSKAFNDMMVEFWK